MEGNMSGSTHGEHFNLYLGDVGEALDRLLLTYDEAQRADALVNQLWGVANEVWNRMRKENPKLQGTGMYQFVYPNTAPKDVEELIKTILEDK